jgi:hypothetical protein
MLFTPKAKGASLAITEQPVGSLIGIFVPGDHTKRSSWANSFFMLPDQHSGHFLNGGPGVVTSSLTGTWLSFGIGPLGGGPQVVNGNVTSSPLEIVAGNTTAPPTGIVQVYILDDTSGPHAFAVTASSLSPTFPVGSLPICVFVSDGVGRIQQVIDVRPSGLSSAPDLGSGMRESVVDATKRIYFAQNYAVPRTASITPLIPPDLHLPAPGFFLGGGSVSFSGNTISSPTTYVSCSAKSNSSGLQLAANAINQGFVDPNTGQVAIRQVPSSGTFPANSLALFEATTDSVSLIRNLVDMRPSYL